MGRSLVRHVVGGGVLGLALCLAAMMIGFRLDIAFVVVVVIVTVVQVWVLRQSRPARHPIDHEGLQVQIRNTDPEVHRIEGWLHGSQPHNALTTLELQRAITALVEERIAARPTPTDLSGPLRRYLTTTPAPSVGRSQLRKMIMEIDAL